MTILAIELNDAGIRLAHEDGILGTEPGCALMRGEDLVVGSEAFRAARLEPLQVLDRFWTDLSLDPLPRAGGTIRTNADIAFAQLSSLWSRFGKDVCEVVLVVPASFTMEQLGLLLGMAEACEMPIGGVVDAAVASSQSHPGCELFHLEMGLHNAVLTHVEQDVGLSRGNFEILEGTGLASLRDCWAQLIAAAFLTQTRFDPLHDAHAEQALYDRLPEFLEAAVSRGAARIELLVGERAQVAEIRGFELTEVTSDVCGVLASSLERLRSTGSTAFVQIGAHAAMLPGVASVLAGSRDVETHTLAPEAACMGALSRLAEIRRSDGRIKLVTRLGVPVLQAEELIVDPSHSLPKASPTHVVYRGWVYQIGSEPFTIGTADRVGGSGIRVPRDEMGKMSTDAQVILRQEGSRLLVDDRGCDVLLNGDCIEGHAELRVGDVVHIGSPGVDIQLVALVGESMMDGDDA